MTTHLNRGAWRIVSVWSRVDWVHASSREGPVQGQEQGWFRFLLATPGEEGGGRAGSSLIYGPEFNMTRATAVG